MIVFIYAGYSRPPAWLGIFAGILFIAFIAIRVHRDWLALTGYEIGLAALLILMGGLLLVNGLTDLFHR